jgi:hypothetical protein
MGWTISKNEASCGKPEKLLKKTSFKSAGFEEDPFVKKS